MRVPAILLASLLTLAAGCASTAPEARPAPVPDDAPGPTLADSGLTVPDVAPATPVARFEQGFDFTLTFAAVEGLGTNANQPNCVRFPPVTMANATATATWDAGAAAQPLQVAASDGTGYFAVQRVEGPSPLTLSFSFPLGSKELRVAVQSSSTGAAPATPVHLALAFSHPAAETPAPETSPCVL